MLLGPTPSPACVLSFIFASWWVRRFNLHFLSVRLKAISASFPVNGQVDILCPHFPQVLNVFILICRCSLYHKDLCLCLGWFIGEQILRGRFAHGVLLRGILRTTLSHCALQMPHPHWPITGHCPRDVAKKLCWAGTILGILLELQRLRAYKGHHLLP